MVCRGTTVLVVVLLAQSAWSAEPPLSPRHTAGNRERVKITVAGNSLKYVIRDPAVRRLVVSKRPVRRVNHELFEGARQRMLVSQLNEDRARDALDALREVTDDLKLDLPKAIPDPSPQRPATRPPQLITPPVEPPVQPSADEPIANGAPLDALQDERRQRDLQLLPRSLNRDDRKELIPDTEPDQRLDRGVGTEPEIEEDSTTFGYDNRPVNPRPIYNPRSNYDQIPWTISGLSDAPDYDQQFREQEFCERIWQCAGGRCMGPFHRWKRDFRRDYEMGYGACQCSQLLARVILEPMLGYGFFGHAIIGKYHGAGCTSCGGGCHDLGQSW